MIKSNNIFDILIPRLLHSSLPETGRLRYNFVNKESALTGDGAPSTPMQSTNNRREATTSTSGHSHSSSVASKPTTTTPKAKTEVNCGNDNDMPAVFSFSNDNKDIPRTCCCKRSVVIYCSA